MYEKTKNQELIPIRKIIDAIENLRKMPDTELNETLLEPKYNKSNLRELIRRLLASHQQLDKALQYERKVNAELQNKLHIEKNKDKARNFR